MIGPNRVPSRDASKEVTKPAAASTRGEGVRRAAEVVDQVTDPRLGTRGREIELFVRDGGDQVDRSPGGGMEVDHGDADEAGLAVSSRCRRISRGRAPAGDP